MRPVRSAATDEHGPPSDARVSAPPLPTEPDPTTHRPHASHLRAPTHPRTDDGLNADLNQKFSFGGGDKAPAGGRLGSSVDQVHTARCRAAARTASRTDRLAARLDSRERPRRTLQMFRHAIAAATRTPTLALAPALDLSSTLSTTLTSPARRNRLCRTARATCGPSSRRWRLRLARRVTASRR